MMIGPKCRMTVPGHINSTFRECRRDILCMTSAEYAKARMSRRHMCAGLPVPFNFFFLYTKFLSTNILYCVPLVWVETGLLSKEMKEKRGLDLAEFVSEWCI